MSEIWIVEERISKKFLDELGHHIRLYGELETCPILLVLMEKII